MATLVRCGNACESTATAAQHTHLDGLVKLRVGGPSERCRGVLVGAKQKGLQLTALPPTRGKGERSWTGAARDPHIWPADGIGEVAPLIGARMAVE